LLASGVLPNDYPGQAFFGQKLVGETESRGVYRTSDPVEIAAKIEDDPNFVIDIGGEGRHPTAVNINVASTASTPGPSDSYKFGDKIPRLFMIKDGDNLPFKNSSVSKAISQSSPFDAEPYPTEIPRVLSPGGTYDVWQSREYLAQGIVKFADVNKGMMYSDPKRVQPPWAPRRAVVYFTSISF
jgi:hypothetical protein